MSERVVLRVRSGGVMSTHTVHVGEVERSGRVEEGEVRGIDG